MQEKKLHFRGCRWNPKNAPQLFEAQSEWIGLMDDLFSKMFGEDQFTYVYDKDKGMKVSDDDDVWSSCP